MRDNKRHYSKHRKYQLKYARIHRKQIQARNREYYKRLREKIIKQLGGKCCKCGFNDKRALQVDHINGGGTRETKGMTRSYYLFVLRELKNGDQNKYQLLCANCNWIKRYEKKEVRRTKLAMV